MMEAAALSPESGKERLWRCVHGLINNQMSFIRTQMSEEGNKNPRTMHKGSAKALPLPLNLAALSLSGDGGDEYWPSHRWICAVYLPVRCTNAEH
jgi:hypothetical protein